MSREETVRRKIKQSKKMKKANLIGLLLISVLIVTSLAACSRDDDKDASLVGTWTIESNTDPDELCAIGTTLILEKNGDVYSSHFDDGEVRGDCWKIEDGNKLLLNFSSSKDYYDDGYYGSYSFSDKNTVIYSYNFWTNPEKINKNPSSFTETMVLKRK